MPQHPITEYQGTIAAIMAGTTPATAFVARMSKATFSKVRDAKHADGRPLNTLAKTYEGGTRPYGVKVIEDASVPAGFFEIGPA